MKCSDLLTMVARSVIVPLGDAEANLIPEG